MAHIKNYGDLDPLTLEIASKQLKLSKDELLGLGGSEKLNLYIKRPDSFSCFEITRCESCSFQRVRQVMSSQAESLQPVGVHLEYLKLSAEDCRQLLQAGHKEQYFFQAGLNNSPWVDGAVDLIVPLGEKFIGGPSLLKRVFCCFPEGTNTLKDTGYPKHLRRFSLEDERLYVTSQDLDIYMKASKDEGAAVDQANVNSQQDQQPELNVKIDVIDCPLLNIQSDHQANRPLFLNVMYMASKKFYGTKEASVNSYTKKDVTKYFDSYEVKDVGKTLKDAAASMVISKKIPSFEAWSSKGSTECLCQYQDEKSGQECNCWFLSDRMKILIKAWNWFWSKADLEDRSSYPLQRCIAIWIYKQSEGYDMGAEKVRWAYDAAKLIAPAYYEVSTKEE